MSLFKDILGNEESLFTNPMALDFDYVPKLIPYREAEQQQIAFTIKPLLARQNGKNILIYGRPGIGKTAVVKQLFAELSEETDQVIPLYINCWQKNTSFKIIIELCNLIGYKFTHNKNTEELFAIVKRYLNQFSAVFAFDEIDKVDDFDFLYYILGDIFRKSIILITNYREWLLKLDERIRSRLALQMLEFREYSLEETKGILLKRIDLGFVPECWDDEAIMAVVKKTHELKDLRIGLNLLREAGNLAESQAKRKITLEHVQRAIAGLDDFSIKSSEQLDEEEYAILELVKANSGKKIGELFELYKAENKDAGVYKTFQRRIEKLSKNGFVNVEKLKGGAQGTTTIVNYKSHEKKLTEF